jgi:tetratricopeptide (TPR) repeat protein
VAYKCSQCGIKVSVEEGLPCPGCGASVSTETVTPSAGSSISERLGKSQKIEKSWIQKVFDQCDEWFKELGETEDLVNSDFDDVTPKVIAYALQKAEEAEDPEDRISLYSYSGRFSMLLKKYDEAIAYARIGLESSQDFYRNQSYETLFRSYTALREFESVAELEQDAIRNKFPEVMYYQIDRAQRERDFTRAIALIDDYYSNYPAGKLYAQCRIYIEMGDIQKADAGYRKLITTSSKDMLAGAVINSYCFAILIPQKRYDEARELLLRATTVSDPRESINAWSNLGIIAMAEDKFSEAREHFAKAIDSDDTDIRNESRYFLCLMNFREYKEQSIPASDSRWSELLKHTQEGIHTGDSDHIFRCTQLMIDTASHLEILPTFPSPVEAALERLESDPLANIKGSDEYLNRLKLVALVAAMYRDLGNFEKLEEILQREGLNENLEIIRLLLDHLRSGSCSSALKDFSMSVNSPAFKSVWAEFETDPIILAKLSITAGPELAMALVGNIATPTHALSAISTILDINVLFKICSHPNVDQEILHSLSKSEFDAVRRGVASSEKTNDQTLQELALDSSVAVREAIKNNPSASDETKTLAALG